MLRALSLAALSLLAVLAAACGGGGGSADADPATAVPANAPFYVSAVVRPDGELRDDTLAAAGKVLRTPDPARRIQEFVEQAFAESDTKVDYARDVEPWLGERIGLWADARADSAMIMLAASDTEAALDAIERTGKADGDRLTERSYRDAEYFVNEDGVAGGVVDDFAIFGQEPQLKRTVDAIEGESLADAERYRKAVDGLEDDRLADFYVDLKTVVDLIARQDPATAQALEQYRSLIPFAELPPMTGAFLADGERLALDVGLNVERSDALRNLGAVTGAGSTPLLGELPGDTWAAYGLGKFGESTRASMDAFGGALGGEMLQQQLRQQLGLDLERDVLSWIGDVAFFVRGTTPAELDGGAVISATDEARAAAAFGRIVGVLRTRLGLPVRPAQIAGAETAFAIRDASLPKPIVLARGDGKVVITYGEAAAVEALNPTERLADSDAYDQAKDVLGDLSPTLLVSIPPIISLVDSSGSADPDFEEARPYLEAYSVFAVGGALDGNRAHGRFAAGLR
jgi:Protein of unknown function (DUF3352)